MPRSVATGLGGAQSRRPSATYSHRRPGWVVEQLSSPVRACAAAGSGISLPGHAPSSGPISRTDRPLVRRANRFAYRNKRRGSSTADKSSDARAPAPGAMLTGRTRRNGDLFRPHWSVGRRQAHLKGTLSLRYHRRRRDGCRSGEVARQAERIRGSSRLHPTLLATPSPSMAQAPVALAAFPTGGRRSWS